MDDLIEALTILRKYANVRYPIYYSAGMLQVRSIQPHTVTEEDKKRLKTLGFFVCFEALDGPCFASHRFSQ